LLRTEFFELPTSHRPLLVGFDESLLNTLVWTRHRYDTYEPSPISDVDMIGDFIFALVPHGDFLLIANCHDIISEISVAYFLLVTGTALDLWRVAIPMT